MAKNTSKCQIDRQNIRVSENIGVAESKGRRGGVQFIGWCIVGLVIRAQKDWRHVG